MNKKQPQPPQAESFQWHEALGESRGIQWLSDHGKNLLWILLAGFLTFLLIYRLTGGSKNGVEQDYFKAENDFASIRKAKDSKSQLEELNKFTALLMKRPELQSKYDGMVAQLLLDEGDLKQGEFFAERTLSRVSKNHLPLYVDYAKTSLVISNGKYEEALTQAEALKKEMISQNENPDKTKEFGDVLYLFNLLRIAMLHQHLNRNAEELNAWEEFKKAPVQSSEHAYVVNPEVFENFAKHLQEGKASIFNYIEAREKALKLSSSRQ